MRLSWVNKKERQKTRSSRHFTSRAPAAAAAAVDSAVSAAAAPAVVSVVAAAAAVVTGAVDRRYGLGKISLPVIKISKKKKRE